MDFPRLCAQLPQIAKEAALIGFPGTWMKQSESMVPMLMQKYGVEVGGDDGKAKFDQSASFRRFLLFARDTIRFKKPMEPDIHWSAISGHDSMFIVNGGHMAGSSSLWRSMRGWRNFFKR